MHFEETHSRNMCRRSCKRSVMGQGNLCLLFVFLILLVSSVALANFYEQDAVANVTVTLRRSMFSKGFLFGTASSAYQYEGAANEGGRGPSIWDAFTHKYPEKIADRSNGDIAVDSYHRYKEDVGIMKDLGLDAYRFSISWSRLLPDGTLKGGVNKEGINYYNNLINELLLNGLQPFVTLFHWDLPQALEDAYGGFLSPRIVEHFKEYAELCFREFGDRVKHWITLNEPLTFTISGYVVGQSPPGRCSKFLKCPVGDSGTEPYIVSHHQILAHAAAVKVYREKYQVSQNGQIGITLNTAWILPLSQSNADKDAASRVLDFNYGWYLEPLYSGSYPTEMVKHVGKRLPRFSKEEFSMVKGSFDFIGVNYYTSTYAADTPCSTGPKLYFNDYCVKMTNEKRGIQIGPQAASSWLYIYPPGIKDLLLYTKQKFGNPVIYITENGIDDVNNNKISLEDNMRIDYLSRHLLNIYGAIKSGVDVRGYFTWSLLDNFEWNAGYTVRFGLVFVDYKDKLKRYPKKSALWFKNFLHHQQSLNN